MSRKWRVVVIIAFVVGGGATAAGFALPRLDSFLQSFLAAIAVSGFAFAIAVVLIEGPIMTREGRLQRVVSVASRNVAQLNQEIAVTLVREIAEYLASRLDSDVNLYGEERGNWTAFKRLLRAVFNDAENVPVRGLPRSGPISKEDYLSYVEAARRFMDQVGSALGSDWEVQARLLELVECRERLDARIREAGYPGSVRDEKTRYAGLAAIGDAMIDLVERCPRIEE